MIPDAVQSILRHMSRLLQPSDPSTAFDDVMNKREERWLQAADALLKAPLGYCYTCPQHREDIGYYSAQGWCMICGKPMELVDALTCPNMHEVPNNPLYVGIHTHMVTIGGKVQYCAVCGAKKVTDKWLQQLSSD